MWRAGLTQRSVGANSTNFLKEGGSYKEAAPHEQHCYALVLAVKDAANNV